MPFAIGIADFISDPHLLGHFFSGPSWRNWRTVLKGAFAEPLNRSERILFRQLAERDPPTSRVREMWLAIGRRAGKDSVASAIAAHSAVSGDFERHLRPGERAVILCLAVDRTQARIVFGYIRGYFERVRLLRPLVKRITDDTIELLNGVDIVVATNSFRGLRGRTVALAILDELAFWLGESGPYVNPDVEVYSALVPALATLRRAGAMIIGISTVYRRSGLLFDKWRRHHGKDDDVLVIRGPSRTFNPLLDPDDIQADIDRDPQRGAAEWLSEWRSDLADYVDRAVVESAVRPGCYEIPPAERQTYVAFVDPSGGSSDSFTLAICHCDADGRGILDCVREVPAPFSPAEVVGELADTIRSYRISTVVGDKYAGEWPAEQFQRHGIAYEASERTKGQIYLEFLPLLNSGRVELLDSPRLVNQLCSLERRTARGGRDSIDHPPGAHDDVANSVAGGLVLVAGEMSSLEVWRRLASPRPRRPALVHAMPPSPPQPGPGEVLIDIPHRLNVDVGNRIVFLEPGQQIVPDGVADHPIVKRFVIA